MKEMKEWIYDDCLYKRDPKTGVITYWCARCGRAESEAVLVRESGYYQRTVYVRCKCGAVYSF